MDRPDKQKVMDKKAGKVYQVDEVFWNMTGGIQGANYLLDDLFKFSELN